MVLFYEMITRISIFTIWLGIMAAVEWTLRPFEVGGPAWFLPVRAGFGLILASTTVILLVRHLRAHRTY